MAPKIVGASHLLDSRWTTLAGYRTGGATPDSHAETR